MTIVLEPEKFKLLSAKTALLFPLIFELLVYSKRFSPKKLLLSPAAKIRSPSTLLLLPAPNINPPG
jgi:hypothetical protein